MCHRPLAVLALLGLILLAACSGELIIDTPVPNAGDATATPASDIGTPAPTKPAPPTDTPAPAAPTDTVAPLVATDTPTPPFGVAESARVISGCSAIVAPRSSAIAVDLTPAPPPSEATPNPQLVYVGTADFANGLPGQVLRLVVSGADATAVNAYLTNVRVAFVISSAAAPAPNCTPVPVAAPPAGAPAPLAPSSTPAPLDPDLTIDIIPPPAHAPFFLLFTLDPYRGAGQSHYYHMNGAIRSYTVGITANLGVEQTVLYQNVTPAGSGAVDATGARYLQYGPGDYTNPCLTVTGVKDGTVIGPGGASYPVNQYTLSNAINIAQYVQPPPGARRCGSGTGH